ncbi:MAG: PEP-CTERM sorting domain-containing protein, partial [Planctomycetota bacterium]|nr:PEP-CTERM sorting domain-containing protein [Planctomycetota bacterium]
PHWLVFDSDEDVAAIEVNRENKTDYNAAHRIETTIWLGNPLVVNQCSSGELTLAGVVGGNGSITKRGDGVLVLEAANNTTLSSDLIVEEGVLCAADPNALGTGDVLLRGGDLHLRADDDALFPNRVEATADAALRVEPDAGGAGARLAVGEFKSVGGLAFTIGGSGGYGLAVAGETRFTLGAGSVCTLETATADLTLEGTVQVMGGTLRKTGPAALTFASDDPADMDFWEETTLIVEDGTVRFHADAGAADRRNLVVQVDGSGAVEFASTQHLADLHLADGTVTCVPHGARALVTGDLQIDETGGAGDALLDLADNNLVVDYDGPGPNDTLYDAIEGWVTTGYNGGNWNGNPGNPATGITTADGDAGLYALGVLDNGAPPAGINQLTTLDGEDLVDLVGDLDCIIVRYTYYGDADMNGEVDFDDVQRLILSYNVPPAGDARWAEADFNYDNVVDFTDVQLLIAGWNLQGAPLGDGPAPVVGGSAGGIPTPEPATLALLGLGAVAMLARRRRTR